MDVKIKLSYLISQDWYYISHRESLALAALKKDYDVSLITQVSKYKEKIQKSGVSLIEISFFRSFKNIFQEFRTIKQIYYAYNIVSPDIIHQVSLKPCFYGALALFFYTKKNKLPIIINAFTGLGYVFSSGNFSAKLLRLILLPLFKILFMKRNMHIVFQNISDKKLFLKYGVVKENQMHLISGSGVDVNRYTLSKGINDKEVIVMLVARMLIEKGVYEFIEAAKIINKNYENVSFILVGDTDEENPSGIPRQILEAWQNTGIIEWWGKREDMVRVYHQADIVVLPSYREGLPKVLLEAAACGKPVITTDVPGCRDAIIPKESGLLVSVKDTHALAEALEELINNRLKREKMGLRGRKLVEERFSTDIINGQFLKLYDKLLESREQLYCK